MGEASEHEVRTTRRARFYALGPASAREVWLVCHGYRQLAGRFIRRFEALDDGRRRIVAPEALSRFYIEDEEGPHGPHSRVGASWMTREDRLREIADYVEYLDRVAQRALDAAPDARLVALGFSQGAATASRWALAGRSRPHRLVLWAGAVAHDVDLAAAAPRLRALRPIAVVGDADPHVSDATIARERLRLAGAGVDFGLIRYAGGHRVTDDALRALVETLDSGQEVQGP